MLLPFVTDIIELNLELFVAKIVIRQQGCGSWGWKMQVEAVLFDLFDTLLLMEGGDAFYLPSLHRLHEFLIENHVRVSFEDFARAL
jgi:hypothetical protein